MANTVSRSVELQIKLQGVESLQQLEEVTAEINQELKQVDINSQEFTAMGDLAKKANSRVKEISTSLEGITSTEKSEAINKMGMALLGAFQGAAGASLLFGEQTSESMNKAIKAVGGLFAITDSVKKITEAFSAKNISALKSVYKGWVEATAGAKIFGVSVKTALISTGIGALVVALGLIIANFDKIKNLVNQTAKKEEEAAQRNVDAATQLGKRYEAQVQEIKAANELSKKTNELNADAVALAEMDAKLADKELTATVNRIQQLEAENEQINVKLKRKNKLKEGEEAELSNQLEVNKALIQAAVADTARLTIIVAQKTQYIEIAKAIDDNNKLIEKSRNLLTELNAQENNKLKIYTENRNILKKQIENIDSQIGKTKIHTDELDRQRAVLVAQLNALDEAERIRTRDLAIALDKLKAETKYSETLNKQISLVDALAGYYDQISQANDEALGYAERQEKHIEYQAELYAKIAEVRNEIVNFDKKGQEIFAQYYQDYSGLYQKEVERLGIAEEFNKLGEKEKRTIGEQLLSIKNISDAKLNQFNTELKNNEALLKNLDDQKKAQQDIVNTAQERIGVLEKEREGYEKSLAKVKAGSEEELYYREKIKTVNTEISDAVNTRVGAQKEITNAELKQSQILETNKDIQSDINQTTAETLDNEKELTYQIQQQARFTSKLKDFIGDYSDEIQTTQDLIGQTFELMATQDDRRAEMKQREIDDYIAANEKKLESDKEMYDKISKAKQKAEEDAADKIEELNSMLADAEGERYQQVLDEIAAQQLAKSDAHKADIDAINAKGQAEVNYQNKVGQMEADKQKYEFEAAKKRKTAAIIDAVINTALGVIKALPNIFLAAATGVLGAVGIATISSQPLPPAPQPFVPAVYEPVPYKKGGYTGDGDVNQPAGIVHAGEYVVPQYVMKNPKAIPMVQTLEGMRVKGYAEGGIVTTPNVQQATQNAIDYKQIGIEVANSLRDNPMFVSWQEWRDMNNRMEWITNRASLGKK